MNMLQLCLHPMCTLKMLASLVALVIFPVDQLNPSLTQRLVGSWSRLLPRIRVIQLPTLISFLLQRFADFCCQCAVRYNAASCSTGDPIFAASPLPLNSTLCYLKKKKKEKIKIKKKPKTQQVPLLLFFLLLVFVFAAISNSKPQTPNSNWRALLCVDWIILGPSQGFGLKAVNALFLLLLKLYAEKTCCLTRTEAKAKKKNTEKSKLSKNIFRKLKMIFKMKQCRLDERQDKRKLNGFSAPPLRRC